MKEGFKEEVKENRNITLTTREIIEIIERGIERQAITKKNISE